MNRKWILAGLCLLLFLAVSTPGRSQDTADDMAGINRSLERMVVLLETLIGNQQVDILLKRIELQERRLAPLESGLRRAERAMIDVEARLERMKEEREAMEDVIAEEVRDGIDKDDSDARRMRDQLDRVLESESARVEEMRRRVLRLEDELADGREEIVILDEQLRELLQ
jgi:septal ring factor EnvC (AmiA/AmiB activator)